MTEDPQADAGERTRSAHRAIEIREKRRRVLSSCPAWITLRGSPFHLIGDGRVPAQLVQAAATGAAAVAAGWWEHGAAVAEQHAQRSVHLVTAVLLQDVPDIVVGTGTWNAGALARWTASDGKSRVGVVLDTAGAKAGSTLPIWVDGSGRQTDPPLTRRGVRSRVITAAALTSAAFAITLLSVAIWLRWLLNRRRRSRCRVIPFPGRPPGPGTHVTRRA